MNEKMNIADYSYTRDAEVTIKGELLMALLNFFSETREKETVPVMLYDKQQIKDGRENSKRALKITDLLIEDTVFDSPQQFLQQPVRDALTLTGTKCLDFQYVLEEIHYKAIEDGVAIKTADLGTFNTTEIGRT